MFIVTWLMYHHLAVYIITWLCLPIQRQRFCRLSSFSLLCFIVSYTKLPRTRKVITLYSKLPFQQWHQIYFWDSSMHVITSQYYKVPGHQNNLLIELRLVKHQGCRLCLIHCNLITINTPSRLQKTASTLFLYVWF